MTKLPIDSWDVHGFDGPDYQLSKLCARPGCLEFGRERHHIWRRSHVAGDFNWVTLPDGSAAGNLVMLCHEHHRLLTENEAKISFEYGSFYWIEDGTELLPLAFQPPWVQVEYENTFENPGEKTEPVLENECPVCHQALPRPKIKSEKREERRPRRSWTITVPKDKREDGAETLDVLLEEARVEMDKAGLGYGPERNNRFFVLATILGLFVSHFRELINEG